MRMAHGDLSDVLVCLATSWKSETGYAATATAAAAFAVAACFCISV